MTVTLPSGSQMSFITSHAASSGEPNFDSRSPSARQIGVITKILASGNFSDRRLCHSRQTSVNAGRGCVFQLFVPYAETTMSGSIGSYESSSSGKKPSPPIARL